MRDVDPTPEEAIRLFEAIEEKFPSKTLGEDKWYLVAVRPLPPSPPNLFL
jgi:hypothetical protein